MESLVLWLRAVTPMGSETWVGDRARAAFRPAESPTRQEILAQSCSDSTGLAPSAVPTAPKPLVWRGRAGLDHVTLDHVGVQQRSELGVQLKLVVEIAVQVRDQHIEVRRVGKVLPEECLPINADDRKLRNSADHLQRGRIELVRLNLVLRVASRSPGRRRRLGPDGRQRCSSPPLRFNADSAVKTAAPRRRRNPKRALRVPTRGELSQMQPALLLPREGSASERRRGSRTRNRPLATEAAAGVGAEGSKEDGARSSRLIFEPEQRSCPRCCSMPPVVV